MHFQVVKPIDHETLGQYLGCSILIHLFILALFLVIWRDQNQAAKKHCTWTEEMAQPLKAKHITKNKKHVLNHIIRWSTVCGDGSCNLYKDII